MEVGVLQPMAVSVSRRRISESALAKMYAEEIQPEFRRVGASTIATRNEFVPTKLPATGRQDSSVEATMFHVADFENGLAGLGAATGTYCIGKP